MSAFVATVIALGSSACLAQSRAGTSDPAGPATAGSHGDRSSSRLIDPQIIGGTQEAPIISNPTVLAPDGVTAVIRLGDMGLSAYAADGVVFGGPVAIGVPNPSGAGGSSVGQSIVLGCNRSPSGMVDGSCSAGGVNGGFNAPGLTGLQAMLNYGGVDAVGEFIGAGPYLPPVFTGVTLSGSKGTHVAIAGSLPVPEAFRRAGTWVQLTGLTAALAGRVAAVAPDGLSFDVTAWGDQSSKAAGVDAARYRLATGAKLITATVGYVSSLFGYNHVVAVYPTGPAQAVGGETDVICDRAGGCPMNAGVTVNGAGNYQNGTGLECNGGVGGNADVPNYSPAWTDCLTVRGFSYRGVYVEMNFNGTVASNATAGVYVDTIGTEGKFPFVVHNATIATADRTGNVFSVDATGAVVAGAVHVESLTTKGSVTPGALLLTAATSAPLMCGPDRLGAHVYIIDGRKPGERHGAGSGVPADCTPPSLPAPPSWVSVYDHAAVVN